MDLTNDSRHNCSCTGCPSAEPKKNKAFSFFLIALIGGVLLSVTNIFGDANTDLESDRSLSVVFLLGLLTGTHCIGMCGGFMLSYLNYGKEKGISLKQSHFRYAVSKTLSYTVLGGIFGAIGSSLYFSNNLKAAISVAGGLLLIYVGARVFKLVHGFGKLFKSPRKFERSRISNPIYIGLLNGLMLSCGPLQAMYLVAAGIGDPGYGMLLLFVFALGTLPLFLFYGFIIGKIKNFRSKWTDRITASIVVVFGILMINRGMALSGASFSWNTNGSSGIQLSENTAPQLLTMTATKKGWGKDVIYFEPGRKIKWIIDVQELNMCNRTIEVPALGIKKDLTEGKNEIVFHPEHHTSLVYTCWMGMMKGEFRVKE